VQGPTKYDIVYDIRQKVNTQAVQGRYYPPRRQSRGGGFTGLCLSARYVKNRRASSNL